MLMKTLLCYLFYPYLGDKNFFDVKIAVKRLKYRRYDEKPQSVDQLKIDIAIDDH